LRPRRLERTIYISGFSKILVPNWRVGFLAAPAALVDRFVDTKLLSTLTTPGLTEQALAHCLEQGLLRRHAERVMAKLEAARSRTVKLAEAHGCRFAAPPRGLFGWVDVGVDTERLAAALLDDWFIAPGRAVPRGAAADDLDAHQLRDLAGCALLARAGAGARCAGGRGRASCGRRPASVTTRLARRDRSAHCATRRVRSDFNVRPHASVESR
jgi:hypothetical protein